ncbi:hypothetical protein A1OO_11690 [Enterovibrio norvegicus FF-33]|uniref:Uncharacterized protein n=1 Tax=Enterovibrio norvegicus FF-454 TaxID=1185651 RepID=A0A1E5BYX1_9GAMM|nr:hypothetical protein [Enterovibrio norvegicus]OEE58474.1 hypothetical protein A1OK_15250 [Enterovibrio norvegicus FF-454]OEE66439.1 hypothetical protein A1OO_11690 [Enterovibrio norvegicus FF-33]
MEGIVPLPFDPFRQKSERDVWLPSTSLVGFQALLLTFNVEPLCFQISALPAQPANQQLLAEQAS